MLWALGLHEAVKIKKKKASACPQQHLAGLYLISLPKSAVPLPATSGEPSIASDRPQAAVRRQILTEL